MKDNRKVSRRGFIETAGAATGAVMAAGAFPHPAVGSVKGANEKLNIAILGPGGRAQEHLRILLKMKNKEQKPVDIIGLCDVWDGNGRRSGDRRGSTTRPRNAAWTRRAKTRTASPRTIARSSTTRTSTSS